MCNYRLPSAPLCLIALAAIFSSSVTPARADEDKPPAPKSLELGTMYELQAPATWVSREPRSQIIDHEFAVPKAAGDEQEGRVTVMAATGSVEANVDRWYGQFTQPDGSNTKDSAKVEKKQIAGKDVTIVDISGTYMDRPAPVAAGVERKDYRMLAAIIPAKQNANYFIKFYGPKQTVADNAEAFKKMVESLKAK